MIYRFLIQTLLLFVIATPTTVFAQSKSEEPKSPPTEEADTSTDQTVENPDAAEASKKDEEPAAAEKAAAEKAAAEKAAAGKAVAEKAVAEKAAAEKAAAEKAATIAAKPMIPEAVDYNVHTENARWDQYVIWAPMTVIATNLFFWQFSMHASDEHFPLISARQIEKNLTRGWYFDDNEFEVNMFAHPYQGGLYFLAGRVNNMGFWESSIYSALGSSQWELMMENESPAPNDFILTVFGGMYLGEVMYRLSNLLLDDSTSGAERSWREVGAGILAPIKGFDRLYTGATSKVGPAPIKNDLEVKLRFGVAGIPLDKSDAIGEWKPVWKALIKLDYGNFYKKEVTKTPYDQWDFEGGLLWNLRDDSVLGAQFDGNGTLYGWRLGGGKNMFFGFAQNYEFFTNGIAKILQRDSDGIFQLGQTSMGPMFKGTWQFGRFSLDLELKVMPIILGGVTSPYAVEEVNRTYNYGPGVTSRAKVELIDKRWGSLKTEARRYFIHVIDGVPGNEFTGMWNTELFFNIYGGHGIMAAATLTDRESFYDDPIAHPDIDTSFWLGRLMYQKVW